MLSWIYSQIPETTGCLENINKTDGCGSWCCSQSPQVLYVEFLYAWNHISKNWTDDQIISLILKSLKAYLFDASDGCVFWDKENNLCGHHDSRCFNCRVYGIIPEEEFKPRYERLKILYPETRNQCDLVSTKNGKAVTKRDTDQWWRDINNAEMSIGIDKKFIHDGFGGTYRRYYEHVLLHILQENDMELLSEVRVSGSEKDKENLLNLISNNLNLYVSSMRK